MVILTIQSPHYPNILVEVGLDAQDHQTLGQGVLDAACYGSVKVERAEDRHDFHDGFLSPMGLSIFLLKQFGVKHV